MVRGRKGAHSCSTHVAWTLANKITCHQLEGGERPPTWLVIVVVLLSLLNGALCGPPSAARAPPGGQIPSGRGAPPSATAAPSLCMWRPSCLRRAGAWKSSSQSELPGQKPRRGGEHSHIYVHLARAKRDYNDAKTRRTRRAPPIHWQRLGPAGALNRDDEARVRGAERREGQRE